VRGILSFCLFFIIVFYVWILVMMALKWAVPKSVAGWSAGGDTVDVGALRKARVPRMERRRRIIRSWRIQWIFLMASIGIPITTLIMTRNGLKPLISSLDEVESINDEVESVSYQGLGIAESLLEEQDRLLVNFTQQDLSMENMCPGIPKFQQSQNHSKFMFAVPMDTVVQYIQAGLSEVNTFVDNHAPQAHNGLTNAVGVAEQVDLTIEWSFANDWALKFFLLTINVVNGFLVFGIFLSKQDIILYKYQRLLSFAIIPGFGLLLICSMLITCAFGIASMLNADFCYGNRSATGTIAEILTERGTATTDISYQAFMHYMEGCLDESPLDYIHSLDAILQHTMDAVVLLEGSFDAFTSERMNQSCVEDVHDLVSRLPELVDILKKFQFLIRQVIELTGCHKISPILRRILHGATCSETVDAITWLFGGMCTITILGFIMLTTRAGLFNAVVKAPRRKRRKEREKEFDEYKEYMAEYYADADGWNVDLPPKKAKVDSSEGGILRIPTFDTEETSKSMGDDDCESDVAHFASPSQRSVHSDANHESDDKEVCTNENSKVREEGQSHGKDGEDDMPSEYSYESDYLSDDSEEERSIMSTSIIGRFFHTHPHQQDDAQSSLLGMSIYSSSGENQSNARPHQTGIIELQTPRRRRRQQPLQQPAPYAGFVDRSPDFALSPDHNNIGSLRRKGGGLLTPKGKQIAKEY